MLTRLCREHWAGTRGYQLLLKLFLFLTWHWEPWGSPRWSIEGLTWRNWRYQQICSVFSLYPHCFATFLYSHVFLYINILKIFCCSLFIQVKWKTTAVSKVTWRAWLIPVLYPKDSVQIHFQMQPFGLGYIKQSLPLMISSLFLSYCFIQRNLVHLKYTNSKPTLLQRCKWFQRHVKLCNGHSFSHLLTFLKYTRDLL